MARPVLEIRELWVHRRERAVCRGISLQVPAGAVIGLVGGPGSGKSTLLACAALELAPSAGAVLLHGVDVTGAPEERRQALRATSVCLVPVSDVAAGRPVAGGVTGAARAAAHERLAPALAGPFDVVLVDDVFDAAGDDGIPADDQVHTDGGPGGPPASADAVVGQVEAVHELLRRRARRLPAVVLASRNWRAVAAVADAMVVLRDGVVVDSGAVSQVLASQRWGDAGRGRRTA